MKSILNQTYTNIEIIVINDSPNYKYCPEIRNIIAYYKNKESFPLYYFENKINKGANYSRNKGIHYSHGEFLAFLDDDDEWLQDKLSNIIVHFNDPDVGLVYSDYYRFTLNDEKINVFKAHRHGFVIDELLAHNIIGPTSGVVIRKECLKFSGSFDVNLPARQDYDLWLRISRYNKVSHIKKFLYIYHDSQVSISTNVNRRIEGRERILKKYHSLYNRNKSAYRYTLFEYYLEMLINQKYYRALKIMLLIILRTNPPLSELKLLIKWLICSIKNEEIDYIEFY